MKSYATAWQSTMEIKVLLKKSDICWEESIVHRNKKAYEHLFLYSTFCANVLSEILLVQLLCISYFLCHHKYTKITSMEVIILGGHPVALVGQAKDVHQHLIWCFHRHAPGGKSPWTPCNDPLWCPHMQHSCIQQRHLISCSIYTCMLPNWID